MRLEDRLVQIRPLDEGAMKAARRRWDQVAKPLGSLGLLEDYIVRIAGITGSSQIDISRKALVIMCADNGVVEEGVTQTGQEVTAVVTENFTKGESCVCIMAKQAGIEVYPVDIGVAKEIRQSGSLYPLIRRKIMPGTRNFFKGPAMTIEEARSAVDVGIGLVEMLKQKGCGLILTGEMGIGNTTTSSAVASVLLGKMPQEMTGKGAGLSEEGLATKIRVIEEGIRKNKPDWKDGLDVLAKVGGLDLAGLAGVFLGGALCRIPVLIDGFISAAAALAAAVICPEAKPFMVATHVSAEPAGDIILKALGLTPVLCAHMCLGEGTGAVAVVPMLDMAAAVYESMSTFEEIHIDDYHHLF